MSSIQKSPFELERDYRLALEIHNYYTKIRSAIIQKAMPAIILKPEGCLEYKYPEIVEKLLQFYNEQEEIFIKSIKKEYYEENNVQ
ncbi:MAG: hypothetical protein J6X18_17455 [Bacteroidales bacterium]|nr:hypothetical protein [Bacteroidales bacterium]